MRFIHEQSRAGLSARSLARLVSSMRSFYRYLVLDGMVEKDPADGLSSPSVWLSLPKFLTMKEVEALLAAPDDGDPRGVRDRAMLEVLYGSGLRVSELIALRPKDINLDEGFLLCRGKGERKGSSPWADRPAGRSGGTWMRPVPFSRRPLPSFYSSPAAAARSRGRDFGNS